MNLAKGPRHENGQQHGCRDRRRISIGNGLAIAFHERSNLVIVGGRRLAPPQGVCDMHPGMVGVELYLRVPMAIRRVTTQIVADQPRLNVLVNNAAIMQLDQAATSHCSLYSVVLATDGEQVDLHHTDHCADRDDEDDRTGKPWEEVRDADRLPREEVSSLRLEPRKRNRLFRRRSGRTRSTDECRYPLEFATVHGTGFVIR